MGLSGVRAGRVVGVSRVRQVGGTGGVVDRWCRWVGVSSVLAGWVAPWRAGRAGWGVWGGGGGGGPAKNCKCPHDDVDDDVSSFVPCVFCSFCCLAGPFSYMHTVDCFALLALALNG